DEPLQIMGESIKGLAGAGVSVNPARQQARQARPPGLHTVGEMGFEAGAGKADRQVQGRGAAGSRNQDPSQTEVQISRARSRQ
ncbi:MAG: hypothetical protein JWM33_1240, partial [Caulobacteraceae bacterium]|nr:hypothetical protein [Caulobacteraceae bacterium]